MQAVSLLLGPLIMSGADMLFSSLQKDSYLEEQNRHNKKIEKLENDRFQWDKTFAEEQQKFERRRLEKQDAKEFLINDQNFLTQLLNQKAQIKGEILREKVKHQKKNPYYFTTDLILTCSIGIGVYKVYSLWTKKNEVNSET